MVGGIGGGFIFKFIVIIFSCFVMNKFFLDFETYSPVDLGSKGVYQYADHKDFKVLTMAYAVNENEVKVLTDRNDVLETVLLYCGMGFTFVAHNANFERIVIECLCEREGVSIPPIEWIDTMHLAQWAGLPASLDDAAKAIGIGSKLSEGKDIIKAVHKGKAYNIEDLKEYNKQDVVITRRLYERLIDVVSPNFQFEKDVIEADRSINDTGVRVDMTLINSVQKAVNTYSDAYAKKVKEEYGDVSFTSPKQVKALLVEKYGVVASSLDRATVKQMLVAFKNPKVLSLLTTYSNKISSQSKKYDAFRDFACVDDRCRGLFMYYGASRTGRWSSRGVQLQNILRTKNDLDTIRLARQVVKEDPALFVEKYGDEVPDLVGDMIRTCIIPSKGKKFYITDFNAIEARVLAWLAGEEWRNKLFEEGGKLYETTASKMLGLPIEKCGKGTDARYIGKCAELAFGYQGAIGAWQRITTANGVDKRYSEQQISKFVSAWRQASPNIVNFWGTLEKAWQQVIRTGEGGTLSKHHLKFGKTNDWLWIRLPSGRRLYYYLGSYAEGKMFYFGVNQTTRKFERRDTYGGALAENITQAVSRDLLAHGLTTLITLGYNPVMHIHDEVIIEIEEGGEKEIDKLFTSRPSWAADLNYKAEGFLSEYYIKA